MKILFIGSTFPDNSSPARGTYNSALCKALAVRHQVYAVSPRTLSESMRSRWNRKPHTIPTELSTAGIRADFPTYLFTPKMLRGWYGKQMWWSIRRTINRVINDFQPDAVLSYWAHPEGEVGLLAAQAAGVPSAVIVGGTDVLILPRDPNRGTVIRRVLNETSAVISVSEGLRQAVIKLGIPAGQVRTIYQGIEPAIFHGHGRHKAKQELGMPAAQKALLWVGRMVPVKGLEVLISGFARLRAARNDVQLYLIGDGPCRRDIELQLEAAGLRDAATFLGAIGHDQIANWYRAADLTVMSSHSEGLPNVLRESLACGTPFVSTAVGSIREIADDRYCKLVDPGDYVGLADAMDHMLDPEYLVSAASYEPRSWHNCAEETASLLTGLIHGRHSQHESGEQFAGRSQERNAELKVN